MLGRIIIFIISILSIDLFYIVYKLYKKLWLKRVNFAEKNKGLPPEEFTQYEDVIDKKLPIIYGICAIIISFYINFINTEQMNNGFLENLLTNFESIALPILIYITCAIIWSYIKGIFNFIKGVKESFDIKEDLDENLDEDESETEEIKELEETIVSEEIEEIEENNKEE